MTRVNPAPAPPLWDRSVPSTAAALALVAEHYPIAPTAATLVRSFVNDVFRIDSDRGRFALKIYGARRFSADEVRWEQQFARHLVAAGIPTAEPVRLSSGDDIGILDAPEGERPFALTRWLPGDTPRAPFDADLYSAVGAALAELHLAADSFRSDLPRRPVRTGEEPRKVLAALDDSDPRRDLVQRSAAAAISTLDDLSARGLHRAARHGDPSLDNLHLTADGRIAFYDLDLAGPGWQVEDLTGALSTEFSGPFLDAYVAVRPLADVDLEALPWLRILGHIDNLAFHLVTKPRALGTATLTEGWVDRGVEGLAAAARDTGLQTALPLEPDPGTS